MKWPCFLARLLEAHGHGFLLQNKGSAADPYVPSHRPAPLRLFVDTDTSSPHRRRLIAFGGQLSHLTACCSSTEAY